MEKIMISDVNAQKQKVLTDCEMLLENPTAENMQAYRITIKDFVSFAVMQLYINTAKSAGSAPHKNLYAQVSRVDFILQEIGKSVDKGDRQNLAKQCGQMNELLDCLLWYN